MRGAAIQAVPEGQTDLWDTAWNSDFTNALTHLRAIGGSIDDTLDRADRIVRLHWEAIQQVAANRSMRCWPEPAAANPVSLQTDGHRRTGIATSLPVGANWRAPVR